MASITNGQNVVSSGAQNLHNLPLNKTAIQNFYSGKNIFITGGTGFLGKLLVEKLLWSCPDIGDIYLLVRDKKGKDLQSRVENLMESMAFCRVRRDVPGYMDKIRPIAGDCVQPLLGISEQDRNIIINEVNIVFHVAASVRFHEPLPFALAVNVRATKDVLELVKQMKNLKSFVHVSTAFTHCYENELDEKFYDMPMDPIRLMNFVETADPDIVQGITNQLVGKWPNTYTFTKALAEEYLRISAVGLPIGIFRPSIVVSAFEEPVPRWVDNWYGLSGFITACSSGLLRVVRASKTGVANVVPADMCVNGLIAAGWDVADRFKEVEAKIGSPSALDIRIYNYVLGTNPITWGDLYDVTSQYGLSTPPSRVLWYKYLIIQPNAIVHEIGKFFLHFLPGLLMDTARVCTGNSPQFLKLYKKIDTMEDVTVFFSVQNWHFSYKNTTKLLKKMSPDDRKLYSCDMDQIHWMEFLRTYFLGVRRYLLKEDDSTIPAAKKKYFRLYLLHRAFQFVLFLLTINGLYKTVKFIKRLRSL